MQAGFELTVYLREASTLQSFFSLMGSGNTYATRSYDEIPLKFFSDLNYKNLYLGISFCFSAMQPAFNNILYIHSFTH